MGGGVVFSASPAKKKGQVYIAKGSAPWYNVNDGDYYTTWPDKDKVINIDKSVSGQATVTCKGITDMNNMFASCSNLTSIDLSGFDSSNVTNMYDMFADCPNLTSINLSSFNTSKVKDMSYMFAVGDLWNQHSSLTSLDLSSFDTSNVTTMEWMFSGCFSLTSLDLSSFDTSKIRNMSYMFISCPKLTSLDLSNFNTSNVTDMGGMFYNCPKLTSLDLSNFNTSNVTSMQSMFYECSNLTTIKGIIDMKSCTDYGSIKNGYDNLMFHNCPKLSGVKIKNPPSGFNGAGLSSSQYTIVS